VIAISGSVDDVAHVIQVALTPVFLLSGVASLLSVLSTRLGRVADRVDSVSEKLDTAAGEERRRLETRLVYLDRRTKILDAAVIMATLGGVSTSLAALTLFVDVLREHAGVSLFIAFGLALLMTMGALVAFLFEMLLASRGIRHEAAKSSEDGEPSEAPEPAHEGHEAAAPEADAGGN
jgi:hypothetical protein